MGINGMNERKKYLVLGILLTISYLIIAVLFIYNFSSLSNDYANQQKNYIIQAETAIKNSLEKEELSITELDEIVKEYPMELVIELKDQILYKTVPYSTGIYLVGSVNEDVLISESYGNYENYTIWYALYNMPANDYLQNFLVKQSIIFVIAFILLMITVFINQRLLFQPLKRVKKSIASLESYQFDQIKESEDEVNQRLEAFAQNLESNISAVSRKHTQLEQALQLERERLNNTIIVSRSFMHDLKSPIHYNLLENEYLLDKLENPTQETVEIVNANIKMNESLMKTVNEVLAIMKGDFYDVQKDVEEIDLVNLTLESIKLFARELDEKKFVLDLDMEEKAIGYYNKATVQLLIHNLISNMVKYATKKTTLSIQIVEKEDAILMSYQNKSSKENIERMKNSEQLFNVVQLENSKEHVYSSGNGLFLIKDLTTLLEGNYELSIRSNLVEINILIPKQEVNHEA